MVTFWKQLDLKLKEVFETFRLETFVLITDISRCYRSVRTSETANLSRLHIYPEFPFDPHCLRTVILKYLRLTFGDAIAANVIEQAMIYFVTKRTSNELTKIFLKFYRFVDDLGTAISTHYLKRLLIWKEH